MEYDADYYDKKWKAIIPHMPTGGQYRYDLRKHGYQIVCNTIPDGAKVFDYASGLSVIGKMLIEKGCTVNGCDWSEVAINWSKENIKGEFRKTDKVFGGPYDAVIAMYFLEHIKNPVEWIDDMLKHTNRVICALPNNFNQHGEHIDMQWNSWDSFNKLFAKYKRSRLDVKDGKRIYPAIGQFMHPIFEFNPGGDMHPYEIQKGETHAISHQKGTGEKPKVSKEGKADEKKQRRKKRITETIKKFTQRGTKSIDLEEETTAE